PPIGPGAVARALIARRGRGARIPASVRAALYAPDTPPAPPGDVETRLVGSNTLSLRAMAGAVPAGAGPLCLSPRPLEGAVAEAAALILRAGAGQGAGVWLWGGETTVRIEGPAGQGGRNQELALRVALGAQAAGWTGRWAFLSGGSDGRDGPTEAAGGIVGPDTIARIRAAGLDPEAHLARHDSLPALRAGGALLVTGETGTNVADFQILVRGAG
ncbi:MAG: MOFRL family protein, partial [Gemmobacter sp.]